MRNIFYKITFTCLITILFAKIFAQDITLYNMTNLYQSKNSNPAYQSKCKLYVGLPVVSSFYFNLNNSNLMYTDVFKRNILDRDTSWLIDVDKIYSKLDKINYLNFENQFTLLALGFWIGQYNISLDITPKIFTSVALPKGIFDLKNGNYRDDGTPIDFSGLAYNLQLYNEYAIGVSKQIDDKLTIGAKFKYLLGIADFSTKKTNIEWYTDTTTNENFPITIKTDYEFNACTPYDVKFRYDEKGIIDSAWLSEYNIDQLDSVDWGFSDIKKILTNKSRGFGIDLGVVYKINNNFTVSGSLIDLGWINWKSNPRNAKNKDEFKFSGFDVARYGTINDFLKEKNDSLLDLFIEDMTDTLIEHTKVVITENSYKTFLRTKIHLSANYTPLPWLNLGILYRGYFYNRMNHNSLTFSATANVFKGLSASVNYSIRNDVMNNFGLGFSYKIGCFQWYFITDQIRPYFIANKNEDRGERFLKTSKEFTLHFGMNLLFGCNKTTDYGIID